MFHLHVEGRLPASGGLTRAWVSSFGSCHFPNPCSAHEVLPDPSTVARPRAVLFTTTHGELACVGGETLSLSTRVAACLHGVSLLPCISISLVWSFSQQLWAASTGSWRVWVGNTFLANEGCSAPPRDSLLPCISSFSLPV